MLLVAVLVGLNVVFYVAMLTRGGTEELGRFSPGTLVRFGALHAPLVRRGEAWRVFTAMFLHVSPQHLVTNMVTLVCAGILAVPRYGRARVAIIYVAAGLAGSLLSTWWRWSSGDDTEVPAMSQGFSLTGVVRGWRRASISAGASAAICGLIAASAVRAVLAGEPDGTELFWGAGIWAVCMLLDGTFGASDNVAHAGGLMAGALLGSLLPGRPERWMYSGDVGLETLAVVLLALAGAAFAARARDPDYRPQALMREGDGLLALGLTHDAIERYQRALWLAPRFARAHLRVAQVRWAARDVGGALDAAMMATDCDPNCDEAHSLVREVRELVDRTH